MYRNLILTGLIILLEFSVFSQTRIPIIKATIDAVNIKEGKILKTNAWFITPEQRPDIYKTSCKNKNVTFYTNIDSITFKVKPNKTYNFIILLNGKDSAFTQIKYESSNNKYINLEILKKGRKYNFNDTASIKKFTYKNEQDSMLLRIKNKFNLDSIAGVGDELSKILNLLHWVHNSFLFDGTKETPPSNGIDDLMTKCYKSNNTMYCGALSWVLNSCYLAMGFKSRQVVCLPKDSTDNDCHSINTVYSNTLNKWLWIDPSFNAYVMNNKGELLSIAEVREYLIKKLPLILNPDANINRTYSVLKENYLFDYMAKNLYAFECFIENAGENRSNLLLPVEYNGIIPRTKSHKPKCTNNPDLFWTKPE